MRCRRACLLVLAIVAVGSCGGSSDDTSTDLASDSSENVDGDATAGTDAPADSASEPDAEAAIEPLGDVTVVREPSGTESVIGIDGGTISATDADGTTFELIVAPGSLVVDTTIVMTPARLEGVPFPTSTVMFEPTGLNFLGAASLTITPATAVPLDTRLLYELNDDATEFTAALPEGDGTTNSILVPHFSGYGVATATSPERAALLERGAAEAEKAVQSALAEALQNAPRDADGSVSRADFDALIDEAAEIWETEVIAPRLEAASASCQATATAVAAVIGFERQNELLSRLRANRDLVALIQSAYAPGGPCEKEAIAECTAAEDPAPLVRFWLERERANQLIGGGGATTPIAELVERAKRICAPVTYTASGADGEASFSGTVEAFDEPFTVDVTFIGGSGSFAFVPSSETAGSITVEGSGSGARLSGNGSYTAVENDDGTITVSTNTNSCVDVSGVCRDGAAVITLTPNE